MRAAVVDRYGPPEVVEVRDVPRPEPGAGQVLVRVRSVAVTSGDARVRGARFPPGFGVLARLAMGIRRPRRRILGSTFSGEIETVGPGVDDWAPGDRVCGMTGMPMGAHAEWVAVDASRVVRTPPAVSDDDGAGLLFGGSAAWHFVCRKASIGPGATVLVIGASGAVGSNAVQLAKHLGATVTGVTSGGNTALVAGLGADRVIDHTKQDVLDMEDRYDLVVDAVGTLTIRTGRRLVRDGGVLALVVAGLGDTIRARRGVVAGPAPERTEDFEALLALLVDGHISVLVDGTYGLDEIVEAYRRVDGGHKVGNVLVHP